MFICLFTSGFGAQVYLFPGEIHPRLTPFSEAFLVLVHVGFAPKASSDLAGRSAGVAAKCWCEMRMRTLPFPYNLGIYVLERKSKTEPKDNA